MAKRGRPQLPVVIDRLDGTIYVVDGPKAVIGREVHWREVGEKDALVEAVDTFLDDEDEVDDWYDQETLDDDTDIEDVDWEDAA